MTTSYRPLPVSTGQPAHTRSPFAGDVVAGLSTLLLEGTGRVARSARPVMGALGRRTLHPPLVPRQLHPARLLAPMAARGAAERRALGRSVTGWLDELVPLVLAEVLRRANVTELVLQYLDVDKVVAAVDLDGAAARLDLGRVLDRIDVPTVVDRVDVDSVVRRVDIPTVLSRIDVEDVVRRVDVDAVAQRLDLDAFLARADLTALVLGHVDLDALVEALLEHLDLVALAEQVIDGVDLPGIIRESTGTMASDTVRGARMQGIAADEAVGRAVDRLLLRRRRRMPAEAVVDQAVVDQAVVDQAVVDEAVVDEAVVDGPATAAAVTVPQQGRREMPR